MNATVHRFIMFGAAVLVGIAGIAGISDQVGGETVGWLASGAAILTIVGNSWRILFPATE